MVLVGGYVLLVVGMKKALLSMEVNVLWEVDRGSLAVFIDES